MKNIFYLEPNSKSNVDIHGITVFMWENHDFETIFTSNDVINIQYVIGKVFGYRERAYSMGVNAYFVTRLTNRPHATPNYVPGKYKLEFDCYR